MEFSLKRKRLKQNRVLKKQQKNKAVLCNSYTLSVISLLCPAINNNKWISDHLKFLIRLMTAIRKE
jgi:hypothetical protein